ncbi:hypothetical protein E3J84_00330 [Candidatus Aerophobetes bacterium]|uniref:Peptidase A2 domain-containing protein n=1 Tax=Aerophobetes bacterium TaxID=2030807 RepID=A0A523S584_UNCAE|nr:MAG: hypothetical protein E3J84_00330 [Candidatus Aerophobetes bacterium]
MIFQGRYENEGGIFRPYIGVDVLSPANEWVIVDFLIDPRADETFLDFSFIKKFNVNTKGIDVRDDVGGVGGSGVPYFQIDSALKLISPRGTKVFSGKINVFLEPHSSEVPLLGRDVLDNFVVIFDRKQNSILLLDEEEQYKIGF